MRKKRCNAGTEKTDAGAVKVRLDTEAICLNRKICLKQENLSETGDKSTS